jgi:hypothetical protein
MIEGIQENSSEEFSDFPDYLREFENIVKFDSETCPICGVNLSDSISIDNSPYVNVISTEEKSKLEKIVTVLRDSNIKFKVEERLDNTILEKISYVYDLFIPIKDCEAFHKILESVKPD